MAIKGNQQTNKGKGLFGFGKKPNLVQRAGGYLHFDEIYRSADKLFEALMGDVSQGRVVVDRVREGWRVKRLEGQAACASKALNIIEGFQVKGKEEIELFEVCPDENLDMLVQVRGARLAATARRAETACRELVHRYVGKDLPPCDGSEPVVATARELVAALRQANDNLGAAIRESRSQLQKANELSDIEWLLQGVVRALDYIYCVFARADIRVMQQ